MNWRDAEPSARRRYRLPLRWVVALCDREPRRRRVRRRVPRVYRGARRTELGCPRWASAQAGSRRPWWGPEARSGRARWSIRAWKQGSERWSETGLSPKPGRACSFAEVGVCLPTRSDDGGGPELVEVGAPSDVWTRALAVGHRGTCGLAWAVRSDRHALTSGRPRRPASR